jgi:hypothetical protein
MLTNTQKHKESMTELRKEARTPQVRDQVEKKG